jgi:hypothetical protein
MRAPSPATWKILFGRERRYRQVEDILEVLTRRASERNQLDYYNNERQLTSFQQEAVHVDAVPSFLS